MKKALSYTLIILVVLLLLLNYIFGNGGVQFPFATLTADQIVSIEAHYGNTDVIPIYELSSEETATLLRALQNVPTYNEFDYRELSEYQTVMFVICTSDGARIRISACNPVFIIDGIGYVTESEPCIAVGEIYLDCVEKIMESMKG